MRILRFVSVLSASLLLAGCATFGQINDSLKPLLGQPVDVAIQHFGFPASQMPMGDRTVYRWLSNRIMPMPQYNRSTTYGNVGGTPFSATTGAITENDIATSCELDIAVQNDVMVQYSFRGQLAACQAFDVK